MTTFLIAFLLSYLYHGFGVTVGYHRLLSHRSFKCPTWLEYLIVSGGYLGFEGSPVSWVATHRVHHRYTDEEGDPHRPADGFWHAFAGWLVEPKVVMSGQQIEQVCPDLWRDPVYKAIDFDHTRKHALVCLISCIVFRVVILVLFGPWALLGNLLGVASTFVGPFWVNSVCHLANVGYKNFGTTDKSRNVPWVGLWALGEGWHNNHHAAPQSARHGIRPFEIDISWMFIKFLSLIGLATNVRLPKETKSAPAIDPKFAQLLQTMAAKEDVIESESPELVAVHSELLAQLNAARSLAAQLAQACDKLGEQVTEAQQHFSQNVGSARDQLSDQLLAARVQLAEQLLTGCDQLADQLSSAKVQIGENVRTACEQLSDKITPHAEAERA
ncbi:MAG TPA: fatty acid desaturase [Candidatus Obscuribacterales bacterium]